MEKGLENKESNIESEITNLLETLNQYTHLYDLFEEQWWGVENEAMAGLDRNLAKQHLEELIADVKTVAEKTKDLGMYFNKEVVQSFAEREQNEKNFRVAKIADKVIAEETKELLDPLYVAELGGGAHPDRYDQLFTRLIKNNGHIDWVDISPLMLELADGYLNNEKYKDRKKSISYVNAEILEYLKSLPDEKLNLAIMKYTIDHISDLDELFKNLKEKLSDDGKLISTMGGLNPELKSISTNARFLYNGEEFPENETRTLIDGDTFTVKFFKESNNPAAGYLEGAETTKYYHSPEKIRSLAEKYGFELSLGDWKEIVPEEKRDGEEMEQDVLILRKS